MGSKKRSTLARKVTYSLPTTAMLILQLVFYTDVKEDGCHSRH